MSKAQVDALNNYIIPIIRTNNPTRKVIITGGGANSYESPLQIDPQTLASDNYLIAYFHYYRPFSFTSYSDGENTQYIWGTAADKDQVSDNFDVTRNWSDQYNVPILLGEFGANNSCEYYSRIDYHRYIAEQAINRKFAFSAWCAGIGANKTIHNRTPGSWVENMGSCIPNIV
jgi:endoglucanase